MSLAKQLILFVIFLSCTIVDGNSQDLENIKEADPFSIRGNVGVEFMYYNAWNKRSSYDPFTFQFHGSPVISIYGLELPFSFVAGNRSKSYSQPFSTYGLSPKYKWMTAHAGFRSLNFSKYSLGGQMILGGGVELNPGRFRFGVMGGRFRKAVEAKDGNYPSFKRVGFATKIGYGTKDNYADIVLLKAVDRETSIDSIPPDLQPGENVVFAVKTYQKIPKGIFIEGEWAHSLFAPDVRLDQTGEKNNVLGIVLPFLIKERTGTVGRNAIEASAGYEMDYFGITARFKRIDHEFRSMGAWFFQDDVMNITVDPVFYLWERKLVLGGSVGWERDNLDDDKTSTTKRLVGSANINLSLPKYILSVSFSNYGITQADLQGEDDSLYRIDQVNRDVSMNHVVTLMDEKVSHMVSLFGQFMDAKDNNVADMTDMSFRNISSNALYQLTFIKPGTSFGAGVSANRFQQDSLINITYGPSYNISQRLLSNQLSLNFSHNIQFNLFMDKVQQVSHRMRFTAGYRIKKQHTIGLKCHVHRVIPKTTEVSGFTELKGSISYDYKFKYTKKKKSAGE
ncbi:MAG: hypothetical protein GY751_22555 [Bacteroidetes bacterium]|nr:hypothetical protein [Bacteroidota bacterium]